MASSKRFVLAWNHSIIEPLFALYLGGMLRDRGHAWTGLAIRRYDFAPLFRLVETFGATDVGFNVYSGNHLQVFRAADALRGRGVRVHLGGPHATYFAAACARHADWVYRGQSFDAFAAILDDAPERFVAESLFRREHASMLDAAIGQARRARSLGPREALAPAELADIEERVRARLDQRLAAPDAQRRVDDALRTRILFRDQLTGRFPRPDRETLYRAEPELGANPIKNVICGEGCPFTCTYCYNVAWSSPEMYGRFERRALRPVDDVVAELRELRARDTRLVYAQDDVFGFELPWLRELAPRLRDEVGLPLHVQLRLELARGAAGRERLRLLTEAGCTGVTVAIESGRRDVRREVLDRPMKDADIFEGCRNIRDAGLALRTEQMLGVPTMATRPGGSVLDVDLATLRVNVLVRPEISWTAVLAPYGGTELGRLCTELGLYPADRLATNDDVSDSFFDATVLAYAPLYRDQVRVLQRLFSTLAQLDRGDAIARELLEDALPRLSPEAREAALGPLKELAKITKVALYDGELYRIEPDGDPGAGVSGTNGKDGAALLALAEGAAPASRVGAAAAPALGPEATEVRAALGAIWARVPRGDRIAARFLAAFDAFREDERRAFLALAVELGRIAAAAFALPAEDRAREIERLVEAERAELAVAAARSESRVRLPLAAGSARSGEGS